MFHKKPPGRLASQRFSYIDVKSIDPTEEIYILLTLTVFVSIAN